MRLDTAIYLRERMAIFLVAQAILTLAFLFMCHHYPTLKPFFNCSVAFLVGMGICLCILSYAEREVNRHKRDRVMRQIGDIIQQLAGRER